LELAKKLAQDFRQYQAEAQPRRISPAGKTAKQALLEMAQEDGLGDAFLAEQTRDDGICGLDAVANVFAPQLIVQVEFALALVDGGVLGEGGLVEGL
jgi:hypothetical protein